MLLLALDQGDYITAQKHLHLSVPIFKELVLSYLGLVTEQIDLKSHTRVSKGTFYFHEIKLTRMYVTDLKNFKSLRCTVSLSTPFANM